MKPIKFVILGAAALAILSVFALPFINVEGLKLTLWEMRKLDVIHGYVILGAMALPAVFGALALSRSSLPRWQAIVSVLMFGIGAAIMMLVFTKTHSSFGRDSGIGAKLILVATLAGAAASLVGTVKPEKRLAAA